MPNPFVNEAYEVFGRPTSAVNAPSTSFSGRMPTGIRYNTIIFDLFGTVTAAAGAAAGYGTADVINIFTLYVAPGVTGKDAAPAEFPLINQVRFFALVQFANDYGYVPTQVNAGAGGSTVAQVTFALPIGVLQEGDQVRFEFNTNALATFHTTATAINLELRLYPLVYMGSDPTIKGLIGYQEIVADIIAASSGVPFQLKPSPMGAGSGQQTSNPAGGMPYVWLLGCVFSIRNETARGTLADGYTAMDVTINGDKPVGTNLPERIHKARWAIKRRLADVAGYTPLWFSPRPCTTNDLINQTNEATATTAGTSFLLVYLVPR